MSRKWDLRWIGLARDISEWSKDPSTRCGAVIVRPNRTLASFGYNGFPRGVEDRVELLADRASKYPRIIHAELNAILSATESLVGYTLYQWPGRSCSACATAIIQKGIHRVVNPIVESHGGQWATSQQIGLEMFEEAGVVYEPINV